MPVMLSCDENDVTYFQKIYNCRCMQRNKFFCKVARSHNLCILLFSLRNQELIKALINLDSNSRYPFELRFYYKYEMFGLYIWDEVVV